MSQQYDNNNRASLWKNDRKTEDKHPDYKGSVNVEGVEYWMSGWINTAGPNSKRAGEKYISLRLEMKEGQQAIKVVQIAVDRRLEGRSSWLKVAREKGMLKAAKKGDSNAL